MISNTKIISYLSNRGWILNSETTKFQFYSAPESFGFEDQYLLPVPFNTESTDYNRFLKNTLNILAEIYEVSIDELAAIIEDDSAIFSIRIEDNDTVDGKIGFDRFEELIEGVKELLLDTASFVISPSIQVNSKPPEAYKYLNHCRFLQTDIGSFIAKIELPFNTIIKENEVFTSEITATVINSKLRSVLSYVKESVFDSDGQFDQTHLDTNQENLNLNLLKDIERIYEKTKSSNIEFYFSDIEKSTTINTTNIFNGSLVKLSNLIQRIDEKLIDQGPETLIGRIISLKSKDPHGESNEIIFGTSLNNKQIKVKVKLISDYYKKAVDAHKDKRNIKVKGVLKKMKTQYKFVSVDEFSVPE